MRDSLFSFRGRVARKHFLLFLGGNGVFLTLLAFGLMVAERRFEGVAWDKVVEGPYDRLPDTLAGWALVLVFFAIFAVSLYALAAQVLKRMHDRDKGGWWLAFFLGVPNILFTVAFHFDHSVTANHQIVATVGCLAAWLIILWFLVELLFLSGTPDENGFGLDPRG